MTVRFHLYTGFKHKQAFEDHTVLETLPSIAYYTVSHDRAEMSKYQFLHAGRITSLMDRLRAHDRFARRTPTGTDKIAEDRKPNEIKSRPPPNRTAPAPTQLPFCIPPSTCSLTTDSARSRKADIMEYVSSQHRRIITKKTIVQKVPGK